MKREDADQIEPGLYRFHFLDGSDSDNGVVGALRDGRQWFATVDSKAGYVESAARRDWENVAWVEGLTYHW